MKLRTKERYVKKKNIMHAKTNSQNWTSLKQNKIKTNVLIPACLSSKQNIIHESHDDYRVKQINIKLAQQSHTYENNWS